MTKIYFYAPQKDEAKLLERGHSPNHFGRIFRRYRFDTREVFEIKHEPKPRKPAPRGRAALVARQKKARPKL